MLVKPVQFPAQNIQDLVVLVSFLAQETVRDHVWQHPGGYFVLAEPEQGIPVFSALVVGAGYSGMEASRAARCARAAAEKATRLAKHKNHSTSFASRSPIVKRYGGAIRARGHIYSFAGFSEKWDEALALVTAMGNEELIYEEARAIACSDGPFEIVVGMGATAAYMTGKFDALRRA